jgi:hypothetical protein
MSTLIDHLATDRVRGGWVVFAYAIGIAVGALLAGAALLALIS